LRQLQKFGAFKPFDSLHSTDIHTQIWTNPSFRSDKGAILNHVPHNETVTHHPLQVGEGYQVRNIAEKNKNFLRFCYFGPLVPGTLIW
jgi:hypothetical protein